jgi:hypothetical protein
MSEWTCETLHAFFVHALELSDRVTTTRFEAHADALMLALKTAEAASGKADALAEKRYDAQTEFRATLKEQQAAFVTRGEVYALIGAASALVVMLGHYIK